MCEFLLASSSTMAWRSRPFLNALEEKFSLFPFRGFGVTFSLELRFSELSPSTEAEN